MKALKNSLRCIVFCPAILLAMSDFDRPEHAIYLSVIEVEVIASGESKLRIKIFSDDLQNALRNFSNDYQHHDLQHYFAQNQALAEQYFQAHLKISVNRKPVSMSLQNFTIENDAHFVTFSMSTPTSPNKMEVQADFLMELFPTQTNVVKVLYRDEAYYLKFTKGTASQVLTWAY